MKLKIFYFLLFCFSVTWAETIEVTAKEFMGNSISGKSFLNGNVEVKKGKDILKSNKMEIDVDSKRKLKDIRAIGNVYFLVTTQDGRTIEGKCQELQYDAKKDTYFLSQNAYLKEVGKDNTLNGDAIFLERKTGKMSVKGQNSKPAKLIFNLDDK